MLGKISQFFQRGNQIDIFNLKCEQIFQRKYSRLISGIYSFAPDGLISKTAKGIYFINITSHGTSYQHKFIHQANSNNLGLVSQSVNSVNTLSKRNATLDTLQVLCNGYAPKELEITEYPAQLGKLTLNGLDLNKPNILFAIADDWSYGHAGVYGSNFVKTPAFDRLASEGILFHNVYYCAPQCAPNRASIVTGRNIWENEEAGSHQTHFPRNLTSAYSDGRSVHAPGGQAPGPLNILKDYVETQCYLV